MKLKLKHLSGGFAVGHELLGSPRPKGLPDEGFQRPAFLDRVLQGPRLVDHRVDPIGFGGHRSLGYREDD